MFRARPPSIFITYAWQCDLQKTHVWNVAPATQNGHQMSPKCCACHEKTQLILWGKSICACHTKRCSTHYETCWNVTKCHACHATWSHATFETFKSDSSCRIRQRHSHTMRTVANGLAPSGEHTLNPQTPRVSRVKRGFGKNGTPMHVRKLCLESLVMLTDSAWFSFTTRPFIFRILFRSRAQFSKSIAGCQWHSTKFHTVPAGNPDQVIL